MKSLIKAETRKLLTTRTAYGLLAGMVLLAGPGIILAGQNSISEPPNCDRSKYLQHVHPSVRGQLLHRHVIQAGTLDRAAPVVRLGR